MATTTILQRGPVSVVDYCCRIPAGARPFVEVHGGYSVSYVRKGSFGCVARGRSHELVAGSVMVGFPGDEFVCTHDHACGDECLSVRLSPELVATLGGRSEAWRIGAVPPIAELMLLGERAQACVEGRGDLGLDEAGLSLAARFLEVVSGRVTPAPAAIRRAGAPARRGCCALDRCACARAARPRLDCGAHRCQRMAFPAVILGRSRRHATPVPGALAAAARRTAARRRGPIDHRNCG